MWLVEDMISDIICIPTRWHDAIQGVGKQFDSTKEVRLALIYYYTTKKFVYEFMKNEKTRVTVECIHKKDKYCTWRLHTSSMTHMYLP